MVKKRLFITLFAIFFLLTSSGFSVNPAPRFATPLPAGRMLDEGHDTGFIDWHGSVYYENLYHRDGLCGSGCWEDVTRINSGSSISGSFERDVMYFEAMVASEFGAGTVTVTACSVSRNVYMGTASPTDAGFVSIPILAAIPSGCRDWSVSASGGHVHVRSVDVIYPQPPTISGVLNCSSWGTNAWCTGTETLDLTAYEPQGESVIISGDLNGDPFTCLPGLTCSNPITEEGTGTANYQALSTNGIGSGSTDWKLDTLSPDINAGLVGSFNGLNWSNTDVTLNASVSDATSGVSYFESSLDNATWTPQTSPLALNFSDGTRTIYLHAVDRAGNIVRVQYEIKVDTQNPQLTETFTGTSGSNPWYISDVQVTIAQSDPYPSSGIQYFAYSKDGGATWTNYTTPFTLSEGVYDLQMHLVDNADNQDLKSQETKVDTTVPSISGTLDQFPNALGWINAAVNLSASASDSTSGIASFESSLDNATWTAQSSPLTLNFTDGTYTIYLRAIDNAGHEYLLTQEIKVDSQEPVLSHQILGTSGDSSWYTSAIQVEVTQIDPAPSSGIQAFQTSLDGTNWTDYSIPLNFSEGTYVLQMRVTDNADNQDLDGVPLNVDTTPPTIDATLSGTLGSNNIYISPVEAEVSVSDNLSGIAATEYSLNGSTWQPYTSPLTLDEGVYALQFRTKDTAGLISTTQVYNFSVDTHGPNIKLPSRWYIWETGDLFVKDDGSGIAGVHYEIRDREGRWKKVEQSWDLNQEIFTYEITWNRVFADGTLAPDGEYPVRVTATDHAGHSSQKTALIIVPPANATLLPTFTATPTQTQTPSPTPTAMETQSLATATAMPTMTSTPFVFITATPTQKSGSGFFGFGNPPQQPDTDPQNPNPLIGITAAAVTGAYIATQRKKKVDFGSAPKEAKQAPAVPNVFDGEQTAALMSAFTAKLEEERQRRIAEKALAAEEAEKQNILNYQAVQRRIQEIARAREEARRKREEAKRKAAVNPLQALWDANGAAIYAANQGFKQKYGKNMSASDRRKAIKDATVGGVFRADAYADNLVKAATPPPPPNPYAGAADRIRAAANEIEDEKKIGYQDAPLPKKPSYVVPDMSWKRGDIRAAEDYQKNKELQEGEKRTWRQRADAIIKTPRFIAEEVFRIAPRAIIAAKLLPLRFRKNKSGNYSVSVNKSPLALWDKAMSPINRGIAWLNKKIPRIRIKEIDTPTTSAAYTDSLTESGFPYKTGGNFGANTLNTTTRNGLSDTVYKRSLLGEIAEESGETAAKTGFRKIGETLSPFAFDAAVSAIFNTYDYVWGEKKDETDKLQKWGVSTGVDTVASIATGATAAGIVTAVGMIGGAVLSLAGITVAAPAALVIAATVGVGIGLDLALEASGLKDTIKKTLNDAIDTEQNPYTNHTPVPPPSPPSTPEGTPTPGDNK